MQINFPYKIVLISTLIIIQFCQTASLSTDPNDLMNGNGIFSSSSLLTFQTDNTHNLSLLLWNGQKLLKLHKQPTQQISFQNGIKYIFHQSQPKHIQFKFASVNPNIQDSNLRICDDNGNTLILFRAGRGGLIRVNQKQMISFYNDSVSTDSDIKLTQIDFKILWESKNIQIFVNNTYKDTCNFFQSEIQEVSYVLLYNLYSSTSYWADLVVCSDICYQFNSQKSIFLSMFLLIFLICIFYI